MIDNKIFISDEDGNEYSLNIFFTFETDEKKYVIVYNEEDEESLYPFIYDDEGNLIEIEDEDEFNMVQEVLLAYLEENQQWKKY